MTARRSVAVGLLAVLVIGFGIWWMTRPIDQVTGTTAGITLPELSTTAHAGEQLFNGNCAACHGQNAEGTDKGPSRIHKLYEPNHHGDRAFHIAAANGVRAHHWQFGDMPPVDGVSQDDVANIIAYVRELQRANGIQ